VIGEDSDLNVGVTESTLLSSLNGGNGVDMLLGTFVIRDANLDNVVTINLNTVPPAATLGEVVDKINDQLLAAGIDNLTASLGLDGNNLQLTAENDSTLPVISMTTALADLNRGNGVDLDTGSFIIRSSDDSISELIDISEAETLEDVKDAIEQQLALAGVNNIVVDINAAGDGLQIADNNGPPLDLIIEESSVESTTAADLGITGSIGALLVGSDLQPQPRFIIDEAGGGRTTAADLGIAGNMTYNLIGNDLNPELLATVKLSELSNGLGFDSGNIVMVQGERTVIIDTGAESLVTVQDLLDEINNSGLDITASINEQGIGIQIANDDPTRTLVVKDGDASRAATNLGLAGSTDLLGNVMLLADALRQNNRDLVEKLIEPVDSALTLLLNHRAAIGAKLIRIEISQTRLEEHEVNYTQLLSDEEDADLTRLVTDMAMQENAYHAALQATAKIIQPSLADFIR
jgi:flagellin-like hook-associated protein FlgL